MSLLTLSQPLDPEPLFEINEEESYGPVVWAPDGSGFWTLLSAVDSSWLMHYDFEAGVLSSLYEPGPGVTVDGASLYAGPGYVLWLESSADSLRRGLTASYDGLTLFDDLSPLVTAPYSEWRLGPPYNAGGFLTRDVGLEQQPDTVGMLAFGSEGQELHRYEVPQGQMHLGHLWQPAISAVAVCEGPDLEGLGTSVYAYDPASGFASPVPAGPGCPIAWGPTGRFLVTESGLRDGEQGWEEVLAFDEPPAAGQARFSPDGAFLTLGGDGKRLVDLAELEVLHYDELLASKAGQPGPAEFSVDSEWIYEPACVHAAQPPNTGDYDAGACWAWVRHRPSLLDDCVHASSLETGTGAAECSFVAAGLGNAAMRPAG